MGTTREQLTGRTTIDTFLTTIIYAASGAALGWLQFRGLWETVRRLSAIERPGPWMMLSLFTRTGLSVFGLWLIARQGGVAGLLVALASMLIVRIYLQRKLGPANAAPGHEDA